MSLRVLLVEDDTEIRQVLRDALQVEGYDTLTAASVAEACAVLQHGRPDVVVLDLGLPDGDGATVLQAARRQSQLPVLVVSARHQEQARISLLDAGADDFITKPFGVAELLARIRVALRHRGQHVAAAVTEYAVGALHVNLHTREVCLTGQPVRLTPTEYALLARLVRSAGAVVTHRQLLADVWGAEHVDQTQYLRLYMGQLRAKLEQNPAQPRYLLTEMGVGYRIAAT